MITRTIIPALFTIAFGLTWHLVVGPTNWVALGTLIAAYPLYLFTLRDRLPTSRGFLVIYLAALAWQAVHGAEELLMSPASAQSDPEAWPPAAQALSTLLDACYIVGAIGIVIGNRVLSFFTCAFALRCLLNGVGHPLLAIRDGWTSPGLVTGTLHLVFAILLLRAILSVRRRS